MRRVFGIKFLVLLLVLSTLLSLTSCMAFWLEQIGYDQMFEYTEFEDGYEIKGTPFIVGGDGVKLLTTETNNNLHYLFYALCQYNIQPEGYKRHFSIVKHLDIPIPSLEKQQVIAKTLATLDMKIQKESCLLENLLMQKKAIIKNLFI